jgi:hypothetical protein
MSRSFGRGLVAFLLLFLAAATCQLRAELKADLSPIDFGVQRPRQTLSAEVKLTNSGARPLEILSVQPDCSCTAGVPEKTKLEPNESTKLSIVVETRGYYGPLRRSVRIQTTDGELTIPIFLTVSLFKNWIMEPITIVMPASQRGDAAEVRVTFKHTGKGPSGFGKISCTPEWLTGQAVKTLEGWRVAFTKQASAPAGNYTAKVSIETDDPEEPELAFNVFVPVTSALKVAPNPVILPTVKVGQEATREISIQNWSASTVPRLELAQGTARLTGHEQGAWRFEVTMTAVKPGPFTQILRIYDNASLEAEIPIILRAEPADKDK